MILFLILHCRSWFKFRKNISRRDYVFNKRQIIFRSGESRQYLIGIEISTWYQSHESAVRNFKIFAGPSSSRVRWRTTDWSVHKSYWTFPWATVNYSVEILGHFHTIETRRVRTFRRPLCITMRKSLEISASHCALQCINPTVK